MISTRSTGESKIIYFVFPRFAIQLDDLYVLTVYMTIVYHACQFFEDCKGVIRVHK